MAAGDSVRDDDGYAEDRDPLLVRPFLLGDTGSPAAEPSTQTWPAATTREVRSHRALEGANDPTAVLFLPKAHRRRPARRRVLVVAVACLAVLLGATMAGYASLRGGHSPAAVTALPGDPPPLATTGPLPGTPSPAATKPSAKHRTSPARRATTKPAPAPTAAASSPAGATPSAAGGARVAVPSAAFAPDPPVSPRVGAIRGQNALCLDPGGGAVVQVLACTGSAAQTWTLATDGTLRVSGLCAFLVGDTTVHLTTCDGRTTALWNASGQRLVNAAAAECLTDPSGGARPGTGVTVTTCDGSAGQRWSLP
jgi:hypothetical protein